MIMVATALARLEAQVARYRSTGLRHARSFVPAFRYARSSLPARSAAPPTSRALQAAQIAQLEPHDDEQHREHEQRDRRALAQQAGGHADLVGVGGDEVRGVG